jgi:hypothetical protein
MGPLQPLLDRPRMNVRGWLALPAAVLISLVITAPPASAQEEEEPAKPDLSIVWPKDPKLSLARQPGGESNRQGEWVEGVVDLLVKNAGPAAARVQFRLFVDQDSAVDPEEEQVISGGSTEGDGLLGFSLTRLQLVFALPPEAQPNAAALQITVSDPAQTIPVGTPLLIEWRVPAAAYWIPLGVGVVLALVLTTVTAARLRIPVENEPRPPVKYWKRLRSGVFTDKTWSFSGSWATNITVVGTVLTGLLAATGFLSEVLPGVPSGRFLGLSILFGGIVAISPFIYIALSRRHTNPPKERDEELTASLTVKRQRAVLGWAVFPKGARGEAQPAAAEGETTTIGTVGALLLSSFLTLSAVFGQLLALWQLLSMTNASPTASFFYLAGIVLAILAVAIYSYRTIRWTAETEDRGAPTGLSGTPGTSGAPAAL